MAEGRISEKCIPAFSTIRRTLVLNLTAFAGRNIVFHVAKVFARVEDELRVLAEELVLDNTSTANVVVVAVRNRVLKLLLNVMQVDEVIKGEFKGIKGRVDLRDAAVVEPVLAHATLKHRVLGLVGFIAPAVEA